MSANWWKDILFQKHRWTHFHYSLFLARMTGELVWKSTSFHCHCYLFQRSWWRWDHVINPILISLYRASRIHVPFSTPISLQGVNTSLSKSNSSTYYECIATAADATSHINHWPTTISISLKCLKQPREHSTIPSLTWACWQRLLAHLAESLVTAWSLLVHFSEEALCTTLSV